MNLGYKLNIKKRIFYTFYRFTIIRRQPNLLVSIIVNEFREVAYLQDNSWEEEGDEYLGLKVSQQLGLKRDRLAPEILNIVT